MNIKNTTFYFLEAQRWQQCLWWPHPETYAHHRIELFVENVGQGQWDATNSGDYKDFLSGQEN